MNSKCLVLSKQNTHKAKIAGYPFLIPNFVIQLLGLGKTRDCIYYKLSKMLMLSEAYYMSLNHINNILLRTKTGNVYDPIIICQTYFTKQSVHASINMPMKYLSSLCSAILHPLKSLILLMGNNFVLLWIQVLSFHHP